MIAGIFRNEKGEKVYAAPYFPIGTVYTSVTNVNPSTYFGGTWEAFAQGRTLVGVNADDTDFSTVKKTGGHKNLQSHTHKLNNHTHSFSATTGTSGKHAHRLAMNLSDKDSPGNYDYLNYDGWSWASYYNWTQQDGEHSHTVSGTTGGNNGNTGSSGSGNSQNLQPYITVYFWVRTA